MTPHIAATTRADEAIAFIAATIDKLERGEIVKGRVDRLRGY
jgi:glyoxylate/hydroxypyruvate reductase A